MAIPSRHAQTISIAAPRRTFFVTTSAAGRRNILQSERMAGLMIEVFQHYRYKDKYALHDFVVMPDHIHLLLTVRSITIEKAVQFVKGGFSFRAKRELGFLGEVWQTGFSETQIYTVAEFATRQRYIWNNPVTRGLVRAPGEFRWSSVQVEYRLDATPENLRG